MTFNDGLKPKMFWEIYARYYFAAKCIKSAAEYLNIIRPTVLEIGSNGDNTLQMFIPEALVTPLNLIPENVNNIPNNFIQADASNMPEIVDNSYDFVISCAVLEHIPQKVHKLVLSESHRVAKIGVFHGAPLESEFVYRAEREVSNFNEILFGVKHRWIEEHLINGHPDIKKIRQYCDELCFNYSLFEHMDCTLWTNNYKLKLLLDKFNPELRPYFDTYYQQELLFRDVGRNNLFMYLYIAKSSLYANDVTREFTDKFSGTLEFNSLISDFSEFRTNLFIATDKMAQKKADAKKITDLTTDNIAKQSQIDKLTATIKEKELKLNAARVERERSDKMAKEEQERSEICARNEREQYEHKARDEKRYFETRMREEREQNKKRAEEDREKSDRVITDLQFIIASKEKEIIRLTDLITDKNNRLTEILNSTCWRITSPIRFLLDRLKGM